jgi:hypothetical protein
VGNFLLILPVPGREAEAKRLFHLGLACADRLGLSRTGDSLETPGALVASFPRKNGSGSPVVRDPESGSWLVGIGTWFHQDGYAGGAEDRLLARYLEAGSAALGRELEGFFLLAIGDARSREAIVITDVIGSCHGFVRQLPAGLALSGSSLLLAALGESSLDPVAAQEFLATGNIYEDRTIYREVRKLAPASVYRSRLGAWHSCERYWRISELEPNSLTGEAAARMLWESLTRAAGMVARWYPGLVSDLTGGNDSRALVGAFLVRGARVSTVVSGPTDSPDVIISRGLAALLGLPHLHVEPSAAVSFDRVKNALPFTDGEYDLVEYARVLEVHQRLAGQSEISVNGSFGEVARGYWWELLFPRAGACEKLNAGKVAALRYAVDPVDLTLVPAEARLDLVGHLVGVIERTNTGLFDSPNTLQMDNVYLTMRMQRWQGRIASSTNRLWPCLSPFMFRSVLETMLQVETRLRRRGLVVRKMLARFQPQLAAYPLEHGYPAMPVTWRNFYRFWPVPSHYARKVFEKCCERAGLNPTGRVGHSRESARSLLWREEEVRDLLRPEKMQVCSLLDREALAHFLEASRQAQFPFDQQWSRLLTLEYALRVLQQTQNAVQVGDGARSP